MANVSKFLKGVKGELSYIQWPTRQETIFYTIAVIIVSLIVAAYIGGFDQVFIKTIGPFFK